MLFQMQTSRRGSQELYVAALAGVVGAWLWFIYETSALFLSAGGWLGASGLVALSTIAAALGFFVLLAGLRLIRSRLSVWPSAAHLVVSCLGFVSVSASVLLGAWIAPSIFSSRDVMNIFAALCAPSGAFLVCVLVVAWRRVVKRDLGWRGAWALSLGMSLLWLWLVASLYPEVWAGLEPSRFVGVSLAALGALVVSLFVPERTRVVGKLAVALLLGLIGWAGVGLIALEGSPQALVMGRYAPSTWLVIGRFVKTPPRRAIPLKPSMTSASCHPGKRAPAPGSWQIADEAPHIIFVTVDALRWDHTSLGGEARDTTPHLKRWASKAAVMTRAYTPATSTRQTFGALFTGVNPSLLARPKAPRWSLALPKGQETVASWLGGAGYDTRAIVVSSKVFQEDSRALHGFKEIDVSPRQWWDKHHYASSLQVDRIIAALSDIEPNPGPKFIWTHLMEAHQNYHPGPEPKDYGRQAQDRYDAAIHYIDQELDRLLATALSPARRHNTYVILTADHGHAFREHGQRFHGHTVYDEELHVPLMIWGPDVKAGQYNQPTAVLSAFSTIMELAGAKPSALGFACEPSLLGGLKQGRALEPHDIYVEQLADDSNDNAGIGLIRGDYKLVVRPVERSVELFDVIKDPQERQDLSQTNPKLAQTLLDAMVKLQRARGIDAQALGMFELEMSPAKEVR